MRPDCSSSGSTWRQRVEQRFVGDRADREDAEEQLDRACDVADLLGRHDAGVHEQLDLERVVVAVVGRRDEHVREALEATDARRELRELGAVRRDLGLEEHELDEVIHRVLVVAELRVDRRDLLVAADALLDALDRLELDLEGAREIGLAPGHRVALLEERRGALADEAALRRDRQVRVAATLRRRRQATRGSRRSAAPTASTRSSSTVTSSSASGGGGIEPVIAALRTAAAACCLRSPRACWR